VNERIMSGTFFAGVPPSIAANRPALKPYGASRAPSLSRRPVSLDGRRALSGSKEKP